MLVSLPIPSRLDFDYVAGLDFADFRRRAGGNHVARQQRHDVRNEADQEIALENQVRGAGILTKFAVVSGRERKIAGIFDIGLDDRTSGANVSKLLLRVNSRSRFCRSTAVTSFMQV